MSVIQEPLPIPDEVLVAVLRTIPLQERLTNCALVSKQWQAAAGSSTEHARCTVGAQDQLAAFMQKYTSLQSVSLFQPAVDSVVRPVLLPIMTGITSLSVQGTVQIPPDLPLRGLHALRLSRCQARASDLAAALQGPKQLLTSLQLHKVAGSVSPLLRQLTKLSQLQMSCCCVEQGTALPLPFLVDLDLSHCHSATGGPAEVALHQCSNLTGLRLERVSVQPLLQPALTALQSAKLQMEVVDLSVLRGAHGVLRDLELDMSGTTEAQRLVQFSKLQHLSALQSLCMQGDATVGDWDTTVKQLSQMSWLPMLTSLDLCWDQCSLAPAALQQVVSGARGLRRLMLASDTPDEGLAAALLQLPASCTHLSVAGPGWARVIDTVEHLTGLAELSILKACVSDAHLTQLAAMATMDGLQHLMLDGCYGVSRQLCDAGEALAAAYGYQWSMAFCKGGTSSDICMSFRRSGTQVGIFLALLPLSFRMCPLARLKQV
jgi:hypothetical protein